MTIPENLLENTRHRALHEAADSSSTAFGDLSGATDGQFLQRQSGLFVPHTLVHDDLGGVTTDQHHAEVHDANGADHNFPGGAGTTYLDDTGVFTTPAGGSSITIQEVDGTPSGTPSTLEFPNGTITDHGSGVYEYVPSGVGGTVGLFFPDLPPVSANANDDEFADASLGAAWTEWDPGSKVTVTEADYGLKLAFNASSGDSLGGVRRAVPSADWSLITKVDLAATGVGGSTEAGIFLAEDLSANPTTADIETFIVRYDGSMTLTIGAQRWSAYNALSSTQFSTGGRTHGGTIYLRVRRISSTLYFDFSFDGISWLQAGTMAAPFTIGHVGLAGTGRSSDASAAYFRFWRQTALTSIDQPLLGKTA